MQFCSKCGRPFNDFEKRKSHESSCTEPPMHLDVPVVGNAAPPTPVWQCEIKVGGDTREDMIHLLRSLMIDLEGGSMGPIITGGCSSSGTVKITHNKDMTPEKYKELLMAWSENRKGNNVG